VGYFLVFKVYCLFDWFTVFEKKQKTKFLDFMGLEAVPPKTSYPKRTLLKCPFWKKRFKTPFLEKTP
jgi:hypothetical protein